MRKVAQRYRRAFRRGTHVQAEFPSSYPDMSAFRPLRSTVITRFPATMSRSRRARPPRRVSQVPRLIFLRAPSPTTPRSPAAACAHCFTASVRFPLRAKIDHFPFALTRPKRVHLRYGSRICRSRLRRRDYSRSRSIGYLLNGQLQDKLLSACKISQAFPGTRTDAPPAPLPLMSATHGPNKTLGLPVAMSTKGAYTECNVCATREGLC
jgi:hypothetical protein